MKGKKILKGILIGLLALVIIIAGLGTGIYFLKIKPELDKINETLKMTDKTMGELLSENMFEQVEEILKDEGMQEYLNQQGEGKAYDLITMVEEAKKRKEEAKIEAEKAAENNIPAVAESRYEQIKKQVDPNDLKDALALAGRCDVGYLLGLVSQGLNPTTKYEMYTYLKQRYSAGEIERGVELFTKYAHLL